MSDPYEEIKENRKEQEKNAKIIIEDMYKYVYTNENCRMKLIKEFQRKNKLECKCISTTHTTESCIVCKIRNRYIGMISDETIDVNKIMENLNNKYKSVIKMNVIDGKFQIQYSYSNKNDIISKM